MWHDYFYKKTFKNIARISNPQSDWQPYFGHIFSRFSSIRKQFPREILRFLVIFYLMFFFWCKNKKIIFKRSMWCMSVQCTLIAEIFIKANLVKKNSMIHFFSERFSTWSCLSMLMPIPDLPGKFILHLYNDFEF